MQQSFRKGPNIAGSGFRGGKKALVSSSLGEKSEGSLRTVAAKNVADKLGSCGESYGD